MTADIVAYLVASILVVVLIIVVVQVRERQAGIRGNRGCQTQEHLKISYVAS